MDRFRAGNSTRSPLKQVNYSFSPNDYEKSTSSYNLNGNDDDLYAKMIASKKERERAEEDVHALKNRIHMLMQTEQKTQQQIEETKRKTKHLLELRVQAQRHAIEIQEAKLKQLREEEAQGVRNKNLRESILVNTSLAQSRRQESVKKKAAQLRDEIAIQKSLTRREMELTKRKNAENASKVREDKRDIIVKKINYIEKKINKLRNTQTGNPQDYIKNKLQQSEEISKLEKLELELIKQLHNVRKMHSTFGGENSKSPTRHWTAQGSRSRSPGERGSNRSGSPKPRPKESRHHRTFSASAYRP